MPAKETVPESGTALQKAFSVSFTNVSYDVPLERWDALRLRKKGRSGQGGAAPLRILENVSGHVSPGESLAILGPSGAGKSTLLNLLAGRTSTAPSHGKILFSGLPRVPRMKRYIGYVTQDDIFLSKLTVRQTLEFTADVRLSTKLSAEGRRARVTSMIQLLGLEKCADTIVGDVMSRGISGGERKRLNIANELLDGPSLFLADECTSGLDSTSALRVLQVLEGLCNEDRTVIVTIHQPSTRMFRMFSKIILLAGGKVGYFGRPEGIIRHFEGIGFQFPRSGYNPADYALELAIDREKQGRIVMEWEKKEEEEEYTVKMIEQYENNENENGTAVGIQIYNGVPPRNYMERGVRAVKKRTRQIAEGMGMKKEEEEEEEEEEKYSTSFGRQMKAIMKRTVRQKQGMLLEWTSIAQVLITSILTLIFWLRVPAREGRIEDRLGLINFQVVTWAFYSIFASIFSFPPERSVLDKERGNGLYRLSAYYIGKALIELPGDMIYPLVFTMIVHYACGMNGDVRAFVLSCMVMVLHALIGHSVGLFLSCVFMNARQSQVAGAIWALFALMATGYIIDPKNIPQALQFVRHLSFLRYAFENMVRIEFSFGRSYICEEVGAGKSTVYSSNGTKCPVTLEQFLRAAGLEDALPLWGGILVQCGWILGIRVLGYLALKTMHTDHKPRLSSWRVR